MVEVRHGPMRGVLRTQLSSKLRNGSVALEVSGFLHFNDATDG